jgi:hypothetical protein
VGKRFRLGSATRPPIEIIGVTADIRGVSLDKPPVITAYVPYWQGSFGFRGVTLTVRARQNTAAVSASIRTALRGIDADLPLPPIRTMNEVVEQSVGERRFQMNLTNRPRGHGRTAQNVVRRQRPRSTYRGCHLCRCDGKRDRSHIPARATGIQNRSHHRATSGIETRPPLRRPEPLN